MVVSKISISTEPGSRHDDDAHPSSPKKSLLQAKQDRRDSLDTASTGGMIDDGPFPLLSEEFRSSTLRDGDWEDRLAPPVVTSQCREGTVVRRCAK
mmetsp:Transcript_14884/g.28419  ORF Transcript_14884/g.28419 Transcript_14884/m.28419 type:complete len:96 (-) Transcript_14884:3120-3407(-)